jgi:hypothetical protein
VPAVPRSRSPKSAYPGRVEDTSLVQCPYCGESVELWVDPATTGYYVEDCEVCCRPWRVNVQRGADGELLVDVDRAQ